MSLRFRIALYGLGAVLVITLLFPLVARFSGGSLRSRVHHITSGYQMLLATPLGDDLAVEAALARFAEGGVEAAVYGPEGSLIASVGAATPALRPWPAQRVLSPSRAEPSRTVQTPIVQQAHRGVLVTRSIGPRLGAVGPLAVALVAALVVGAMLVPLVRNLLRPLGILRSKAASLGKGDLGSRCAWPGGDELGAVGNAFDEMAVRIEEFIHTNKAFATAAAHELRTPMARMRVATELAEDRLVPAREAIATIGRNLDELQRLLEAIARLAQFGSHSQAEPLRLTTRTLRQFADELHSGWLSRHGERHLNITIGQPQAQFEADPTLLNCAVDNLLDNAAKYSPHSQSVRLHLSLTASRVRLCVEDDGPGMTAAERQQAFVPFWRSPKHTRNNGLGIGLALVQGLAKAHRGSVRLEPAPGGGLRAILSIPTRQSPSDAAANEPSAR